jgi:hypothetical protein
MKATGEAMNAEKFTVRPFPLSAASDIGMTPLTTLNRGISRFVDKKPSGFR